MAFSAEQYETGIETVVMITMSGVRKLVATSPVVDGAFEDYSFPTNVSIDGIDVRLSGGLIAVLVRGMYGWGIELESETILVQAQEEPGSSDTG